MITRICPGCYINGKIPAHQKEEQRGSQMIRIIGLVSGNEDI